MPMAPRCPRRHRKMSASAGQQTTTLGVSSTHGATAAGQRHALGIISFGNVEKVDAKVAWEPRQAPGGRAISRGLPGCGWTARRNIVGRSPTRRAPAPMLRCPRAARALPSFGRPRAARALPGRCPGANICAAQSPLRCRPGAAPAPMLRRRSHVWALFRRRYCTVCALLGRCSGADIALCTALLRRCPSADSGSPAHGRLRQPCERLRCPRGRLRRRSRSVAGGRGSRGHRGRGRTR